MIFYASWPLKEWSAGAAFGPFIVIRPGKENDIGLLDHEKVHVKQFWRTFCLHGLFYKLSKNYRLNAEAEAYAEQYKRHPENLLRYAGFIVERYKLNVTLEQATIAILAWSI